MSLYAFSRLEQFLDKQGLPKAGPSEFVPINRKLATSLQKGDVEIKKEGIFCTVNGYEHQGFIFNQKPNISRYKNLPKFHIADCEIVQNRASLTGDYIWTNAERVQLYDRGNNLAAYPSEGVLTKLELCRYCAQLVSLSVEYLANTETFHKLLVDQYAKVEAGEPIQLDINGYTVDFNMISNRIRKEKKYICERCHLDLSKAYDRQDYQVHHRNGNKVDNRPHNLECLCIRCHAAVDARHIRNFNSGSNKRRLDAFNRRFPLSDQ